MKLITLNTWGGRVGNPLLDFVTFHREIDIFCFQELYNAADDKLSDDDDKEARLNLFSDLKGSLPEYNSFFRPVIENVYGIGAFVKKGIDVLEEGDILIHENPNYPGRGGDHSRNLQWLECRINDKIYSIFNVHGLWNGKGKTDTPDRIAQSERIRKFMDTIDTPKILCGDFNLRPDTESVKILEKGMKNLIREHAITSTRTSIYKKEERHADYIFVSPEIVVNRFEVLKDEVSDHSPLLLDFS